MPELPEVETIAKFMRQGVNEQPSILGFTVAGSQILWPRTIAAPTITDFQKIISGQTVQEVARRGKFLVLRLAPHTLLIHLRMSGDIIIEPQAQPMAPHYRVTVEFAEGWRLAFNDPRKFGRMWLLTDPQVVLSRLGPEPFDPVLDRDGFHLRLNAFHRQLKPLLMDQHFLAGLGNIYTDEALHLARIHPLRNSSAINLPQSQRLLESIRQVLQAAIDRHGTSIDWVYRGGDYQRFLRVYQRTGLPCQTCGASVERLLVGQRSTHYCPKCQVLTDIDM